MSTVYRNVINLETARQPRKINQHFDEVNNLLKSV